MRGAWANATDGRTAPRVAVRRPSRATGLQSSLLDVQRRAGNRAVAMALQRDDGPSGSRSVGPASAGAPEVDSRGAPARTSNTLSAVLWLGGGHLGAPLPLRLDIDPDQLSVFAPSTTFGESVIPGTPVGEGWRHENRERYELRQPSLRLSLGDGRLHGNATLVIPSGNRNVDPTPIQIRLSTVESLPSTLRPRLVEDQLRLGPVEMEASMLGGVVEVDASVVVGVSVARLLAVVRTHLGPHLGTAISVGSPIVFALRDAVAQVATGGMSVDQAADHVWRTVVDAAGGTPSRRLRSALIATIEALRAEATHPGFEAAGKLRVLRVPVGWGRAGSTSTLGVGRPLPGGPPVPMWYYAYGATIVPAGGPYSTPRPAAGVTAGSFGPERGASFSTALVPGLDPDAISRGGPFLDMFPVDLRLQARAVTRMGPGLDLGLELEAGVPHVLPHVLPFLPGTTGGGSTRAMTLDDLRTVVDPATPLTPEGAYVLGSIVGHF